MKILFLGPADSPLVPFLRQGAQVTVTQDRLNPDWVRAEAFHWLLSYGYRHILKRDILSLFPSRAINLHISLLPWNRGADPNFWSFVENTPKGVTLHFIDEGIDTGDLIAQRELRFSGEETLASSYAQLKTAIEDLFKENWEAIRSGKRLGTAQMGTGSMHRAADKEPLLHLLKDGWDTPVQNLIDWRGSLLKPPQGCIELKD